MIVRGMDVLCSKYWTVSRGGRELRQSAPSLRGGLIIIVSCGVKSKRAEHRH